ncbi:MAG: thioredoxin domain-containing protein [Aggregatilineales bacterium]
MIEQEPTVTDDAPMTETSGDLIDATAEKPVRETKSNDEVFTLPANLINYVIIALLFFFAGIAVGGVVMNNSDGVNESTLRIILNEALADADINSSAVVDYMEDDDPFLGPADAPVVIVEFSDFLCSFCGRHYQQTLEPLLEHYDGYIRYVYRDFPGVGGDYAWMSAMAAECANDQGMFWEFHNILFNNQQSLASTEIEDLLIGFAGELGLDTEVFTPCLQDQEHINDVIIDRSDGQSVGMTGTPGFLINGRFISGAQPYETFAALIDNELEKAGIILEDGNA